MTEFVPPYPARRDLASVWDGIRLARRNVLGLFEDHCFEDDLIQVRVLRRNMFICNSPETVEYLLSSHNDSFERKSPQMRHALEPLIGDGLFISEGETWRRRRRVVAPIVHASRVPQFAPIMIETACEARDRWNKIGAGGEIDALSEMAQLTAEIICRTIFGRNLGRAHARQVVEGFSEYQRRIDQIDLLSLLDLPEWLPRWRSPGLRRAVKRIHAVIDAVVASHRDREDTNSTSVIGRLLDARDEETGEPLDPAAIRNEAIVIFMAGHETTANSLAWCWYLLSQTPEVEKRFHAELDEVLRGRTPDLNDVPRLLYTRAIFEEAIRLYPPVPILAREALKDEIIAERAVPKRALVAVVPWLLHRHRKLWEKPDHFIPERFLPGGKRPESKFAYVPFSIGPRICPGLAFGMREAILCLAVLGQRFQLRLAPGHTVNPICRLTLRPGQALPMVLEPRMTIRREPRAAPGQLASVPLSTACPYAHS